MVFKFKMPKKTFYANGWGYIGRGTGRDYVTVLAPGHIPVTIVSTVAAARRYIKENAQ